MSPQGSTDEVMWCFEEPPYTDLYAKELSGDCPKCGNPIKFALLPHPSGTSPTEQTLVQVREVHRERQDLLEQKIHALSSENAALKKEVALLERRVQYLLVSEGSSG